MKQLLSKLLWLANAGLYRYELEKFYPVKRRILARFGTLDGYDWQEIAKMCYGCDGSGKYSDIYFQGDDEHEYECERCWGTGYFQHFWTKLERRKLGSRVFHTPIDKVFSKPQELITIHDYIKHPQVDHKKAFRALVLLAIMFDWKVLAWMFSLPFTRLSWKLRAMRDRIENIPLNLVRRFERKYSVTVIQQDNDLPF